jgi:hypothetical protein
VLVISVLSLGLNNAKLTAAAQQLGSITSAKGGTQNRNDSGTVGTLNTNVNSQMESNTNKQAYVVNFTNQQFLVPDGPSIKQSNAISDADGLMPLKNLEKSIIHVSGFDRQHNIAITPGVARPKQSAFQGPFIPQCILVPGPSMTFREVCPNQSNSTVPEANATSSSPLPQRSVPSLSQASPPVSTRTPPANIPPLTSKLKPVAPSVMPTPSLQQPRGPINPPLFPPSSNQSAGNNNTNILSLLQNNPGVNSSSLLGPPVSSSMAFKQYNNTLYGVSIRYPSNWRVEEGDNFLFRNTITNVATFIPPNGVTGSRDYHTYVAISIEPTNMTSLTKYSGFVNNQNARLPSFASTGSSTSAFLAGKPAYLTVYSDQEPGFPVKTLEMGTLLGHKVYLVSYTTNPQTFSIYLPAVLQMIKSLSINSESIS